MQSFQREDDFPVISRKSDNEIGIGSERTVQKHQHQRSAAKQYPTVHSNKLRKTLSDRLRFHCRKRTSLPSTERRAV